MNNNIPLGNVATDEQQPLSLTSQLSGILSELRGLSSNSAADTNEALNTFQNVDLTSKKDSSAQINNGNENSTALSDERCKELFGSSDILSAIADIDAYKYRYKEGAENIDPKANPNEEHVGPMAQDLLANPVTKDSVVTDDPSGMLKVDTERLTLTTFALVTELARQLKELEARVNSSN